MGQYFRDMPDDAARSATPVKYPGQRGIEIGFCPCKDLPRSYNTVFYKLSIIGLKGFEQVGIIGNNNTGMFLQEAGIFFPVPVLRVPEQESIKPSCEAEPV